MVYIHMKLFLTSTCRNVDRAKVIAKIMAIQYVYGDT